MAEITDLSLSELTGSLKQGELSSLEITQAYLKRIEKLNPELNAFLYLDNGGALQKAQKADLSWQTWRKDTSKEIPALNGIPIGVKDVLCVKDMPCTCGSLILKNFKPPYHATSVNKLIQAGVTVLGKTNMDEFAMGSSTENSAYGPTRNPWDKTRVPGGSSGGSAAGIAASLAPVFLGTDTGGSIRQPASFCGATGLKPTYGRVSRYGLVAYGSSLDSVGVFAHSAEDVALVFTVMAGYDPHDETCSKQPMPKIDLHKRRDLKGIRIGVPKEYFIKGIQADVEEKVKQAIRQFESLGAEIKEISLPHTEYALPVYYLIAPAEASANLARYDGIRFGLREKADSLGEVYRLSRGAGFGPEVKRRIMLGTYALSAGYYDAYYGQAQKVRTLIKKDFEDAFQQVDAIAAPVAPTTAFPIGQHNEDPLAMYLEDVFTLPANLAGVPGLAFPVGMDHQGLPVGMQLMGPHFREDMLLETAYIYQQATDWHQKRPQ